MSHKALTPDALLMIDAFARTGCGYRPEPLAREHLAAGRLVAKITERCPNAVSLGYAWRQAGADSNARKAPMGHALRWWLDQLASQATQKALLERHASQWSALVD